MSFKMYNTKGTTTVMTAENYDDKPYFQHITFDQWEPFYVLEPVDTTKYIINYVINLDFVLTSNFDVVLSSPSEDKCYRIFFIYTRSMTIPYFMNFYHSSDLEQEICSLDRKKSIIINYIRSLDLWFPETMS